MLSFIAVAALLGAAQRLLWASTLVVCATAGLRLWQGGLRKAYPFLLSYLAYRLVRGITLYALPYGSNTYAWAWLISAPLFWLAYILVVLELYSLVLKNYPGIASLSRWLLAAGLVISITIAGLSLRVDFSNVGERFPIILFFTVIERGVLTSLAIFLLLNTVFLSWYPVPLSRNVIVHSMVCAAFFLGSAMSLLVRNVSGHGVTVGVNLAFVLVDLACLAMWATLMSRAGESKMVILRHHWRAEQQQRLMEQLAAINSTLLRAARKSH